MQIHVSTNDGSPIYLQIVNQVKYLIAAGRLQPNDELPPIRVLAERLLINPNTVARAYRELETAGLVTKRGTAGTYVSATRTPLVKQQRLKILSARIDVLLAEAAQLDVSHDELLALVADRQRILKSEPAAANRNSGATSQ
ncbi:MAG TPA: GntR family transcriptional regulator [Pirellulales bacterium]|nr:GntR family transcriptional regulator [Pirellulales bacterium]